MDSLLIQSYSLRGGEDEEPVGLTPDADLGTSQRTAAICCYGKEFKTTRGMKIHRTKMGCTKMAEQRSEPAGKCKAGEEQRDQEEQTQCLSASSSAAECT